MSYNVYLVDYMGMTRNHHGIFVETHESGDRTGYLYQVTGNIQTGMIHEHKKAKQPEMSNSFGGLKQLIGTVTPENYVHIRSVVNSVPPPKKQFNGPKKIYPNEPLRRCQEWTQEAIQALTDRGILLSPNSGSSSSSGSYWTYSDNDKRYYHTNTDGTTEWAPEASGSGSSSNRGTSQPRNSGTASSSHSYWTYSDKYKRYYHTNADGTTEWAPEGSG
jgi:hypothetical protein